MTECELVRLAGPTERIEIGTNERGERSVVMTYAQGERAGIYRFNSGLLATVERLPEAQAPKPQRTRRPNRT
jgi:hypothetical protein